MIHWAISSGYLEEDFLTGLPPIARKLDAERIDPERVPDEEQVWDIANAGGELEGDGFKVAVLLGAFGAMRSARSLLCAAAPFAASCTKDCG